MVVAVSISIYHAMQHKRCCGSPRLRLWDESCSRFTHRRPV